MIKELCLGLVLLQSKSPTQTTIPLHLQNLIQSRLKKQFYFQSKGMHVRFQKDSCALRSTYTLEEEGIQLYNKQKVATYFWPYEELIEGKSLDLSSWIQESQNNFQDFKKNQTLIKKKKPWFLKHGAKIILGSLTLTAASLLLFNSKKNPSSSYKARRH